MDNTADDIHIALASENNYFDGLLVTAWSIAASCSSPTRLIFHVLDGGISDDNLLFLKTALSKFQCRIDIIHLDPASQLKGLGAWHGTNSMTFARILLPSLLKDVRQVIYTDVDFLWLKDISLLWQKVDNRLLLQHTPTNAKNPSLPRSETEWAAARGFQLNPTTYFCAGMLVLNLAKFREENLDTKMLEFLHANGGTAPMADQTILNIFCLNRNNIGTIDQCWQRLTIDPKLTQVSGDIVLHYASDTPWKPFCKVNHLISDLHLLWHAVHGQIRGISTFASLHRRNTIPQIILCRTIYILGSNFSLVRKALSMFMRLRGRSEGINYLMSFIRKVKVSRQPAPTPSAAASFARSTSTECRAQ